MGDLNEWSRNGRALREFGPAALAAMLAPVGAEPAFPRAARSPSSTGSSISREWTVVDCGVHHSALAARASDHLPVWARLTL